VVGLLTWQKHFHSWPHVRITILRGLVHQRWTDLSEDFKSNLRLAWWTSQNLKGLFVNSDCFLFAQYRFIFGLPIIKFQDALNEFNRDSWNKPLQPFSSVKGLRRSIRLEHIRMFGVSKSVFLKISVHGLHLIPAASVFANFFLPVNLPFFPPTSFLSIANIFFSIEAHLSSQLLNCLWTVFFINLLESRV